MKMNMYQGMVNVQDDYSHSQGKETRYSIDQAQSSATDSGRE